MIESITSVLPIITAITPLISVLASVVIMYLQLLNSRALTEVAEKVETVHIATNSMKDELVKVTGEAEYAKGRLAGEKL